MNIKLTAIVITIFLLLVPIAFADHARYATSSGSYITGAIFAGEQAKIDQIEKRIQEINDLIAQHEGYIKEFPQYTVYNQGQIDILNAEKKKLDSKVILLKLAQYGITPDYVTSPMRLITEPGSAIPTQPTTPSTTPSTPATTPTQPDRIIGGGGEDVIETYEIDYAGPVAEGPAIEPPYYIPTKTGSILYYPGTASNPTPTILEWNPATKTYELQKPASDVSTAGAISPGLVTPAAKTSVPPEEGVPYGADTVSKEKVTLTQSQLNQLVQTAVAAAMAGIAPLVDLMAYHIQYTHVKERYDVNYDLPVFDQAYDQSQWIQGQKLGIRPVSGQPPWPQTGIAGRPLGTQPTGGAGGASGAVSGPQGIVPPGGLGPEPGTEPPTGPGAAEAPKGCLVQYTGTGGYAAASLKCGCENDNACAGFCNSVAEARGERKHPTDITSCTCTPHESCIKR